MDDRLDQMARGPTRAAAWREGVRRLCSRLLCRAQTQPFDFDALAEDLAEGLSRREALRRLGVGLAGALVGSLGLASTVAAQTTSVTACLDQCDQTYQQCQGVCQ